MKIPDYTALGAPEARPSERVASYDNAQAPGAALTQLGGVAQKAGSDMQDMIDVADVNDAMANKFEPTVRALGQNFYSLQGKAAMDGAKPYAESVQTALDDTTNGLSGQAARMFQKQAQGIVNSELYRASAHAGQQAHVYAAQANSAAIENAKQDYSAALLSGDMNAASDAKNTILQHVVGYQSQRGNGPDDPIAIQAVRAAQQDINQITQGAVQNRLQSQPGSVQQALLRPLMHGQPAPGTPTTAPTDQNGIIDTVMTHLEGSALVPDDNGHGPSKYGIVGSDNGLTPAQTAALTPEQAKQLYIKNYWEKAGIDKLPDNMKMIGFDTAVQFGPETAKGMIAQANGDPQALLDIRSDKYRGIISQNPKVYAGSAESWQNRTATLSQMVGGNDVPGTPVKNPVLFGMPVDPSTVPALTAMADATATKQAKQVAMQQAQAVQDATKDVMSKYAAGTLTAQDAVNPVFPAEQQQKFLAMVPHTDNVNPADPAVAQTRGAIENMKATSPEQFKSLDMSQLVGKLPASEITNYMDQQTLARKNDQGYIKETQELSHLKTTIADMMPKAWTTASLQKLDANDEEKKNYDAFTGQFVKAVNDRQVTGGKPLTRSDVRSIASDLLKQDYAVPGHHWYNSGSSSASGYSVDVPDEYRMGLIRNAVSRKLPVPQESEIISSYMAQKAPK